MRFGWMVLSAIVLAVPSGASGQAHQAPVDDQDIRVILLGTQAGPTVNAQQLGIATLVVAGSERLLFDAGRGVTTGMVRAGVAPADVTKVFLTHLHSDHVISLPELLITPWAQGRQVPLMVWGPAGTRSMMQHFQEALAFDIHMRRDVHELFSADGVKVEATDIEEGVVYESNGVAVTAFLVDHGPVKPAFGYRVDYRGHSVVLSGDTRPSENLVKFSSGVDLLIHEVVGLKGAPFLSGPPDEVMVLPQPGAGEIQVRVTRRQLKKALDSHTDGVEMGRILTRVKPKLAVFSHILGNPAAAALPLIRQNYAGPVEFGEDSMTIVVGRDVTVQRVAPAR